MWIVRAVDCINVAFSDEAFKSRKEAEIEYNKRGKSEGYVDLLIRVNDLDIEDYVDYEFNLADFDYDIVRSKK